MDFLDGMRDTVRGYTQQWADDFDERTRQTTLRQRAMEDDQQRQQESSAALTPVIWSGFMDRMQQSLGLRAPASPAHMPPAMRPDDQDLPWGM